MIGIRLLDIANVFSHSVGGALIPVLRLVPFGHGLLSRQELDKAAAELVKPVSLP
jgi:hypothetical protein